MADEDIDYRQHSGRVAFPRNTQDLLGTTSCPACFAPLSSTVCAACGLDVGHPDAVKLYEASVAAAAKLDERLAIIGRIRYETARGRAGFAAAGVGGVSIRESASADALLNHRGKRADALGQPAEQAGALGQTAEQVEALGRPGARAHAAEAPPAGQSPAASAPRRSSVQLTLLIVGVSLLSVAAIFFLVYAFINFGIVWRSVIIGAITIAAFVAASLLRRRALGATAEGIAVFAVVLVYLDAFALRANDLFGAARADAAAYWGVTLVAASLGFVLWHRRTALRLPNLIGFATFAPGVGVLIGGLTRHLEPGTSAFLALAAVAIAGIVHRWAARPAHPATAERIVVLGTTAIALIVALALCTGVAPGNDWAPAVASVIVAAIAIGHLAALLAGVTLASDDSAFHHRLFTRLLAGIAGVAAAAAVGFSASRTGNEAFLLLGPPIAAVAVAVLLDIVAARRRDSILRASAVIAGWCAAAVAVIALATPVFLGVMSTLFAARTAIPAWSIEPVDAVDAFPGETLWAIIALAAVTALAAGAWAAAGMLRSPLRSTAALGAAAVVIVVAMPQLVTQWMVMAGWLLVAAAGLLALLLTRGRPAPGPRHRGILVTAVVAAGLLGHLLGWATTSTWWIGTLAVIGILLASRPLVARAGAKAALLGSGIGLALLSVGSVADQFGLQTGTGLQTSLADRFVLTSLAAVLVLIGSALPWGLASSIDRRVEFWVAAAVSLVSFGSARALVTGLPEASRGMLLLPEPATSLGAALALLLALGLWLGLRGNRGLRIERIAASIAVAPALYLAVSALVSVLDLPALAGSVVPVGAALLAAAGSLLVTMLAPTTTPRWTRELGIALVGVPAVLAAVSTDRGATWLVLLLAAVAVLLLAIDREGLFSSSSPRRQLGWLALALATAGLWWRLAGERVDGLEYYVVPLSLALLAIAGLLTAAARRAQPPRDSRTAPAVALGGLLVSLLPLGVNAATGPTGNAVWLLAVSGVLLVGGSAIRGRAAWQWNADAAALAGAVGVVIVSVGRATFLPLALERDGWLAAGFVLLMIAAFLQARRRPTGDERPRSIAGQALGIVAMTTVLALEIPAFGEEPVGGIRVVALILLFCALHLIAFLVSLAPLTRLLAWVAIAYAVVAGIAAEALDALAVVELASIPIALALLVTGFARLQEAPTERSWRWLAPGTTVLLVSSLLATLGDRPLWRLVGLGLVAIAVIVIAVVRRLQAPFVIGVVVALIHGVATFLPQLRAVYESVPWWLWLGGGGILLIVLAARYERRIQNLKSVAMRFAALR